MPTRNHHSQSRPIWDNKGDLASLFEPLRPFFTNLDGLTTTSRFAATEDDAGYAFTMELPGYKKANVEVELLDGQLSVKATKGSSNSVALSRSITLPTDVDAGSAVAALEDGVLTVTVSKRPEAKPRKIEVR